MFAAAHMTTAHSLAWDAVPAGTAPNRNEPTLPGNVDPLGWWVSVTRASRTAIVYGTNDQESMRILPASSYSQRITATPVELGPFQLAPGAGIIFSQFITHHMPQI